MKAAQLVGPKLFEFIDVERPTITDGECLIKLERVSICGSDIRHGYGPLYSQEHYPLAVGRPCHECAGVVVESRTAAFHEGQRVIVLPGAGMGGLTEYLASNPSRMIALPDHGDLTEWIMCQPSGSVSRAATLSRWTPEPGWTSSPPSSQLRVPVLATRPLISRTWSHSRSAGKWILAGW